MITPLKQSSAFACLWMLTLSAAGAEYQITPGTVELAGNADETQLVITTLKDGQIKLD